MIIKPIKDDKIDNLINNSKDYQFKIDSKKILTKFNSLKNEKVNIKTKKVNFFLSKKAIAFASSFALVAIILGVSLPIALQENSNLNNISSNLNIIGNQNNDAIKAIGKEFLLFNLNDEKTSGEVSKRGLLNYAKVNNLNFLDDSSLILNRIVSGFEKISLIFINSLFDLNSISYKSTKLDHTVTINGDEFNYVNEYSFALGIIKFNYYFNSDSDLDYGYLEFKSLFLSEYYKVELYEVKEGDSIYYKTILYSDDYVYKIDNKTQVDSNYSSFSFSIYQENYGSDSDYDERFLINFGLNNNDSTYTLEVKDNYLISYFDISTDLLSLFTLFFKVDYYDLVSGIIKNISQVSLSKDKNNNNIYDFGDDIKIEVPNN